MHLKEAIAKNKLAEFAAEHGKKYPRASKRHFHALIKAAALGIAKPKSGNISAGCSRELKRNSNSLAYLCKCFLET